MDVYIKDESKATPNQARRHYYLILPVLIGWSDARPSVICPRIHPPEPTHSFSYLHKLLRHYVLNRPFTHGSSTLGATNSAQLLLSPGIYVYRYTYSATCESAGTAGTRPSIWQYRRVGPGSERWPLPAGSGLWLRRIDPFGNIRLYAVLQSVITCNFYTWYQS